MKNEQNVRIAMIIVLVLASAWGTPRVAVAQDCDGQGEASLELVATPTVGGRLQMRLSGRRFARCSVLVDTGAGPITRPHIGTFCLDFGPDFTVLVDGITTAEARIGPSGSYLLDLPVPRRQSLAERVFYVQALIEDRDAPNELAISNMVEVNVAGAFVEKFDSVVRIDAAQTNAQWDGSGELLGTVATAPRMVNYTPPASTFELPQPLVASNDVNSVGCRFQMKFDPGTTGIALGESILGMAWAPVDGLTVGAGYRNSVIKLGHLNPARSTSLSPVFDINYAADEPPVTVFTGKYRVRNGTAVTWFPWPTFTTSFAYDAHRALVFEYDFPRGGQTFQLLRNSSTGAVPVNRVFGDGGANSARTLGENTTYHTQFTVIQDRSYAQSQFLDTGRNSPDYFDADFVVGNVPAGTSVKVTYEGASDPIAIGTRTGFVDDIHELDGKRFIRFRIEMQGDTSNGNVASVESLTLSFE